MDIKISKIKLRRGTNTQRKSVILDQGEIVYTTDTKRLYVGNGVLSGGISPASKVHLPVNSVGLLTTLDAETGDIVVANSKFYQLTGTEPSNINNWSDISLKVSNPFQYDANNTLTLGLSSISAVNLNPNTITNGLKIQNNLLQLDYDTRSFKISGTTLFLNGSSINQNDIASSTFTNGITGGSGNKVGLKVNPSQFYFSGDTLSIYSTTGLSGTNNQTISSNSGVIGVVPNSIDYNFIPSYTFGDGISGGGGQQVVVNANLDQFYFSNSVLSLCSNILGIDNQTLSSANGIVSVALNGITKNHISNTSFGNGISGGNGQSISVKANSEIFYFDGNGALNLSIYDALTGNSTLNSTNSLSSIFNGVPSQLNTGFNSNVEITKFEALSSNGTSSTIIVLSSAGFITFENSVTTKTGKTATRFAIPIFSY